MARRATASVVATAVVKAAVVVVVAEALRVRRRVLMARRQPIRLRTKSPRTRFSQKQYESQRSVSARSRASRFPASTRPGFLFVWTQLTNGPVLRPFSFHRLSQRPNCLPARARLSILKLACRSPNRHFFP
jgi:hypothetical protein